MAHVPFDDAEELFHDTEPKTWSTFFEVVQRHKGKVNGIEDKLIDLILRMRPRLEPMPFPATPKELQDVLNRELVAMTRRQAAS